MSSLEQNTELPIPHMETLKSAARLSIQQDKPVMIDYYVYSLRGKCALKKTTDGDKILFKNMEEYTSSLVKIFEIAKSKNQNGVADLICISENSIYIVSNLVLRAQQS
jgi:hypothetical protein